MLGFHLCLRAGICLIISLPPPPVPGPGAWAHLLRKEAGQVQAGGWLVAESITAPPPLPPGGCGQLRPSDLLLWLTVTQED